MATGASLDYTLWGHTIAWMMRNHAIIAPAYYYDIRWYLEDQKEEGTLAADKHLADFYRGGGRYPKNRLSWLVAQRRENNSTSPIVPIFQVSDNSVIIQGRFPNMKSYSVSAWLDRQMYVFMRYSGHRWLALKYGFGGWVWDKRVTNNYRDRH